jgi:hypothetical protein
VQRIESLMIVVQVTKCTEKRKVVRREEHVEG